MPDFEGDPDAEAAGDAEGMTDECAEGYAQDHAQEPSPDCAHASAPAGATSARDDDAAACRVALRRMLGWNVVDHLAFYRTATGEPILAVARRRRADGGKDVRPLRPMGMGAWTVGDPPGPLPLYGLPALLTHTDRSVIVVEGEAKCDALQALLGTSACVTAWPHGAQSVRKADWSALRGRSVVVWPDHDRAGLDAARQVAACALAAGALSARIVPLSAVTAARAALGHADDVPAGWDAADAIAEGWSLGQVATLIATAERVAPARDSDTLTPDSGLPVRDGDARMRDSGVIELLELRSHDDRERDCANPPPMLVDGLLPIGGLGAIVAMPGVGKSLVATELARCVAGGTPFAGRATMAGRVLYACPDAPRSTERRLLALPREIGRRILSARRLPALPTGLPRLRATLEALAAGGDPVRLVIIDTFDAAREHADGGYASQDGLIEAIMGGLRDLAEALSLAVVVVHHATRGDHRRARGSVVFDARVDALALVSAVAATVMLDSRKNRDAVIGHIGAWRIVPVDVGGKDVPALDYVGPATARGVRQPRLDRAVIDALAGWPQDQAPPSKSELSRRSGVAHGSLTKVIDRLRAEGKVDAVDYRLTDAGRVAADHIPVAGDP